MSLKSFFLLNNVASRIAKSVELCRFSTVHSTPMLVEKNEPIFMKSTNSKAPLIIIFGWGGCLDRYLVKYAHIYQQNNFAVLRYTCPMIIFYSEYRKYAIDVYKKLLELKLAGEVDFASTSIIFHVLSVHGCSLFSALWDYLDSDALYSGVMIKKSTKGIIFDSCPADPTTWKGSHAISFSYAQNGVFGKWALPYVRLLFYVFLCVRRTILRLRAFFDRRSYARSFSFYRLMEYQDMPKHQLYILSDADTSCTSSSILHFVDHQRTNPSNNIRVQHWRDSAHVEHFRYYPREYTKACVELVNAATNFSTTATFRK